MKFSIETLTSKKLIGKHLTMSLTNNKTQELWKSFMMSRKEIKNNIGTSLYSLQVLDPLYFNNFDPNKEFEKWALIEVTDFNNIPHDMETFELSGGIYAVFIHKGSSIDNKIFEYIFTNWLPNSEYNLDNRPHFEILGEKYKNENADSEEEIWIPIKPKNS
jgi:AraC family transcriptional regulator